MRGLEICLPCCVLWVVLSGLASGNAVHRRDIDQQNSTNPRNDSADKVAANTVLEEKIKPTYIYKCTGPFAQYTDQDCEVTGEEAVCYYVTYLYSFFSCVPLCNGVDITKAGRCTANDVCARFLRDHCSPELKVKPTTTRKTTTRKTTTPETTTPETTTPETTTPETTTPETTTPETTTPNPVTPPPVHGPGEIKQKPKTDSVDQYEKNVHDQEINNNVDAVNSGLADYQIVLIVVFAVILVVALVGAVIRKTYRDRNRCNREEEDTEMDVMNIDDAIATTPVLPVGSPSEQATPAGASLDTITTVAEQPARDPKNMERLPFLQPHDRQCTDTNNGEAGRRMPPAVKRRESV